MKNKIFTFGHSNMDSERFFSILNKYNIDTLIDVRGIPYSKYVTWTKKSSIQKLYIENGINYIWMGDNLGGKKSDNSPLNIANSMQSFWDGLDKILELSKSQNIVIMCSESDPLKCHRHHIITLNLLKKYAHIIDVYHILPNQSLLNAREIIENDLFNNKNEVKNE